ncbi:MAG: NAD-dependent deacylase [Anaerolineae bacterium]|nr:NAD-dependent deacylase [Anaerolineae bacterium]
MSSDLNKDIKRAAGLIRAARYFVVFSGAGLSTPSGIPDFRSEDKGLWQKEDPMTVASLTAFRRRPETFFNWLRPLASDIWKAAPNPAHTGLADLEKQGKLRAVLTQNIDGLHQRAGTKNVSELHGSLERFTCPTCHQFYSGAVIRQTLLTHNEIPCCNICGSHLKPDITLFEENLPVQAWLEAEKHSRACDLMLVVGSSLTVYPAAELPFMALQNGAHLIVINYTPTALDRQADLVFHANVAEIIPALVQAVLN